MALDRNTHFIKRTEKNHPLPQAFMLLSFVTSSLLILTQLWGRTNNATANTSDLIQTATPTALEIQPEAVVTALDLPPQLAPAQPALAAPTAIDNVQLVVNLSERQVSLYREGELLSTYGIAIGKAGWETPTGNYQVINMRPDPTWRNPVTGEVVPPGPDNPLGSRWIGFWTDGKSQIGFHGTNQPDLIGQAVSHGCIRMRDPDVQTVYDQLAMGTSVIVFP